MFKVGDKGKTRAGLNYVITRIDLSNYFGPWHQPVFASIDQGYDRCFGIDGTFNPSWPDNDFDLMPPESHKEIEMPEYPCEDEYSLATLAGSAAQIARDHPDLIVQITPGSSAITIFAA